LGVSGQRNDAFEGIPLNNITVATFTDPGYQDPASSFNATIEWGDGTTSAGTVIQVTPGNYSVLGSHTYVDEPHVNNPNGIGSVVVSHGTLSAGVGGLFFVHEEPLPNGTQGTANQLWLSELYRDLFNRQIDSSGLASWANQLDEGVSRFQVVQWIEISPEYRTDQVQAVYGQYLQRSADPSGLASGVAFLQAGGTLEQLAGRLAGSPEYFQNRGGGTNSGFLAALFQDALGRPIDSCGAESWGAMLAGGVSRTQVALDILNSDEYHRNLVATYYNTFLDRSIDQTSQSSVNALNQGTPDQSIIAALVASPEYNAKINPPHQTDPFAIPVSGQTVAFGIPLLFSPWPFPPPPPGTAIPLASPT
jgi:hypothetical protein